MFVAESGDILDLALRNDMKLLPVDMEFGEKNESECPPRRELYYLMIPGGEIAISTSHLTNRTFFYHEAYFDPLIAPCASSA